jgi:hypothetical protein
MPATFSKDKSEARRRGFRSVDAGYCRIRPAGTGQRRANEGAGVAVILDQQDIDVFIRLDVGKSGHHAVALDRAGNKHFDKALPNDETRPEILGSLTGHGKILLVAPAGDRRRAAGRGCPGDRSDGGLSGDAEDRGPAPGEGRDRGEGRGDHRRGRPDDAAHSALHCPG